MRKYCLIILLPIISNLIAQDSNSPDTVLERIDCATPSSTEEQILQTRQIVGNWLSGNRDRPDEQVHILVAFHVLYASDGTGNISDEADVVSPVFKDYKNGNYKIISFYAKKARGLMARFIIQNRIKKTDELIDFDLDGYKYSKADSTTNSPVFLRKS